MEINYDLIIKYLCNTKKEKPVVKPTEKKDFKYFVDDLKKMSYLDFSFENSLLVSIIFLLNSDKFHFDECEMENSVEEMLNELDLDNDKNLMINLCKKLDINIIVIGEELKLFSFRNIVDLSLPFVLLYKKSNRYLPIYDKSRKVYFYHNSIVENLLDNDFKVNHDDYQLLDDMECIVDEILVNKSNDNVIWFTNDNIVNNMEKYKKMKKVELIDKLLENDDSLKKSSLNKLRKNDLIKMLLK